MDAALRDRVFAILSRMAKIDPATLDPDRDIREQITFDSMQFVEFTARVETELGVELPVVVMEASTINEFLRVVEETVK